MRNLLYFIVVLFCISTTYSVNLNYGGSNISANEDETSISNGGSSISTNSVDIDNGNNLDMNEGEVESDGTSISDNKDEEESEEESEEENEEENEEEYKETTNLNKNKYKNWEDNFDKSMDEFDEKLEKNLSKMENSIDDIVDKFEDRLDSEMKKLDSELDEIEKTIGNKLSKLLDKKLENFYKKIFTKYLGDTEKIVGKLNNIIRKIDLIKEKKYIRSNEIIKNVLDYVKIDFKKKEMELVGSNLKNISNKDDIENVKELLDSILK